jgi:L-threonylcarbamoyladenylate synthase
MKSGGMHRGENPLQPRAMKTEPYYRDEASPGAIAEAARRLRAGGLVAFPTETVYGLGANATDDSAVAGIFALKQRPRFNPLIVHVSGRAAAEEHVLFNQKAGILAERFWPGGLTLVLPRREDTALSLLVSAGLDSVAVRVPAHPVARALLREARLPIAAPSANRSGRISPTTAAAVAEELGEGVSLILDGGPSAIGLESTIIGLAEDRAVLLRPGAIARDDIEAAVGRLEVRAAGAVLAPGMLESHYAPWASLRLNAVSVTEGEALLAFGRDVPAGARTICNLSPAGDLKEAAANLFAMLRRLDGSGANSIAVMPIPAHGLGEAINDRLQRAAAPRPPALV